MLLYSLTPRVVRGLTFGMAAILAAYASYYAVAAAWLVVTGALICATALAALGTVTTRTRAHPGPRVVAGAFVAINAGAVVAITGLAEPGVIWLAPLVFVNFLLGGVRPGAALTIVSVLTIVAIGGFYTDPDLALNIVGAVTLSLMMAATYAGAMRAHFTRLRAEALHDPLTGLPNRRAFEAALGERLEQAARPVSVIFLDLDRFKRLNDRFGHASGDRVLGHFAELATRQLRRTDDVYRYGGEEFIVLVDASPNDALRVAEKLRGAVAGETFRVDFDVTVSAGVAGASPDDDMHSLVRRADGALYAAKAEGRNRCALADEHSRVQVHHEELPVRGSA